LVVGKSKSSFSTENGAVFKTAYVAIEMMTDT
jgi:hypothetical protein